MQYNSDKTYEKTLLLIEDDPDLASILQDYLQMHYYRVTHASTGQAGLDLLWSNMRFDLVILDLMLPDMEGMALCQKLRQSNHSASHTPIIMLTAKGDTTDRVLGLEMGADDYMAKPFEPRELLARIRSVIRRHETPNAEEHDGNVLKFGRLAVYPQSHEVTIDDKAVRLTTHQFQLLHYFATNAGKVLGRDQLWSAMPNDDSSDNIDRAIDVHISRLRALIEDNPRQPKRIITVRGIGYQFATDQR